MGLRWALLHRLGQWPRGFLDTEVVRVATARALPSEMANDSLAVEQNVAVVFAGTRDCRFSKRARAGIVSIVQGSAVDQHARSFHPRPNCGCPHLPLRGFLSLRERTEVRVL